MVQPSDPNGAAERVTQESFAYKYRRLGTPAAQGVRVAVLGSDLPNGYTSVAQADRIAQLLLLAPGDSLLDLGSGRGWPGARVAEKTGCRLVVTDLPLTALRKAAARLSALGSPGYGVVCADGLHLPFRDSCFDAASHTDVLC